MKTATWTRLNDGEWGLRIEGEAFSGEYVKVVRKDGTMTREVVGRVLWTDGSTTLATLDRWS